MKYQTIIIAATIFLIPILGSVLEVAESEYFYEKLFEKHGTYDNLGKEKADSWNNEVLRFFENDQEATLEFLTENEKSHMEDVKRLIDLSAILYWASLLTFLILIRIIYSTNKKTLKSIVMKGASYAANTGLVTIVLLGILFAINFELAFEVFHKILFPMGNYTFGEESNLIKLYPGEFWTGIGTTIGIIILIKFLILKIIGCHHKLKLPSKK